MDSTSITNSATSTSSNSATKTISSLTAKLRRLKIDESVLLQSINKSLTACVQADCEVGQTHYLTVSEFKKFYVKSKESFIEIKQLFEDIKESTASKEVIKSIDIDEIKKSTQELDNKIKSFKLYLYTETNVLKSTERQLNQKLNDPISINYLKRKPRVQTAKFTEIVPSPVKTLMSSPFKSSEVQEFQEFMKNSKNRYGGWDEYHHNIFVNLWQKYFDMEIFTLCDLTSIESSTEFTLLLRELQPKLIGVCEEEIKSHVKWYIKYIHLKDRQQKAIEQWRSNRKMMKPSNVKKEAKNDLQVMNRRVKKLVKPNDVNNIIVKNYLNSQENHILIKDDTCCFIRRCLCDKIKQGYLNTKMSSNIEEYDENKRRQSLNFLKSTKQWDIKCCDKDIITETKIFSSVEHLSKLGTPLWRADL